MEYKVEIGGVTYGMTDIQSASIERPLFDKLSVGGTCSARLKIKFWQKSDIPRQAKIIPYARKQSTDPWSIQGIFYTDTRVMESTVLVIEAFDAMLKADVDWVPTQSLNFPLGMKDCAEEIAAVMGVEIDPRTTLSNKYKVDYPTDGYTMRDYLGYVASAHGGNWIMTLQGKLLLIPLFASAALETNYLITEEGDNIVIGGHRILV